MRRFLLALLFATAFLVAGASAASADNCSGPADCEQTGGYNGIIAVVGGAAAVAAAAAAALAQTPEGEETDLAILQVSAEILDVAVGEPAQLTLTGWNAGKDGELTQVGMSISIDVPAGLRATPAEGAGQVIATIEVDEATLPEDADQLELTARGSWKGKEVAQTVTVRVGGDYRLELF